MIRTILIGTTISVQGLLVSRNGTTATVSTGSKVFTGRLVGA